MSDHLFEQPKQRKITFKKQVIQKHLGFFLVFFIAFVVLISQNNTFSFAQLNTTEDLETAIDDKKSEIDAIDAKIKEYKAQIEAKKREGDTLNDLSSRILVEEHVLYSKVLQGIALGKVKIGSNK